MTTKDLESSAIAKYEDLLDTVLVIEAMKSKDKGKSWKEVKKNIKNPCTK
jgi:hypothetical protein